MWWCVVIIVILLLNLSQNTEHHICHIYPDSKSVKKKKVLRHSLLWCSSESFVDLPGCLSDIYECLMVGAFAHDGLA